MFGIQIKVKEVEIHKAEDGKWITIVPETQEFDLLKVSGVEQLLGSRSVEPGNYTQIRLQVTEAIVTIGTSKVIAVVPSGELKLAGSFRIDAGKTTALTVDFDAEKSITIAGTGEAVIRPVATLVARDPAVAPPPLKVSTISKTGIIATVPGYTSVDLQQAAELVRMVYPGRVPQRIQMLLLLTKDDEAYLVLALDTNITPWITAASIEGKRVPPLKDIPPELDWAGRIIVSDSVKLLEPAKVTPAEVNARPQDYAFKRAVMDTTYLFSSARLKESQILKHIGFALASDRFGSTERGDYLTIVDPYNTETQIRLADIYGTVLYPTDAVRRLLGEVYRLAPEDVRDMLDRPSVFFEELKDDEAQLLTIGELVPTPKDPTLKLHKYHGEMVSIKGIAVGEMVRTEDIPQLRDSPIHFTGKAIGVADLTGTMPLVGISSEDVSGEVFGHFQFELSIYRFDGDKAYAFLRSKKTVPLDPIEHVERAKFGERVKSSLAGYFVAEIERAQVSADLVLEQVDLLLPQDLKSPMIMTRHSTLITGDYLKTVTFDGYLIDAQFLGVPSTLIAKYGARVIVVNRANIEFEKGAPPTPSTPPIATPTPLATTTPLPTPTPVPAPIPSPTPVTYTLTVSISPSGAGSVALSPPGGRYPAGTMVTLSAVLAPRYAFDRYSGSISGNSAVATITMDSNKSVVVYFKSVIP